MYEIGLGTANWTELRGMLGTVEWTALMMFKELKERVER
jgi:hypothetical protein